MFRAAEVRQNDPGHWKVNRNMLLDQEFGDHEASLKGTIRGNLGRMGGKFRDEFVARVQEAFGSNASGYLTRLAVLRLE
jgi:hypothetical protein